GRQSGSEDQQANRRARQVLYQARVSASCSQMNAAHVQRRSARGQGLAPNPGILRQGTGLRLRYRPAKGILGGGTECSNQFAHGFLLQSPQLGTMTTSGSIWTLTRVHVPMPRIFT